MFAPELRNAETVVLAIPLTLLPSKSLSKVSVVSHSVVGPLPFTVMADTRNEYSVPLSKPTRHS